MQNKLLIRENVKTVKSVKNWEEAVYIGLEDLLKAGDINEAYIKKIIDNTKEHGPFYIIMPGVALLHSKPEDGAFNTAFSIVLLDEPVPFDGRDEPVKLLIGFAYR